MQGFAIKSYPDSYLYNNDLSGKGSQTAKANNAAIKDFIINATRIENKNSDAFNGIIEELKRQQRSSVLITILLMDEIQLCIGKTEMPRAFKVFDAKDPKHNKQNRIFIDLTGLVEYKNGYYYCKRIDILTAYLMDALVYMLYRWAPEKLIRNSNVTLTGIDNYISMFTYIIDYLRISNYPENKNKIGYFIGLFYLHNMMGLPLDSYAKNIAAKAGDISKSDINAFDLYLDDDTFTNIDLFIKWLVKTFKLNGLTLSVFVSKWAYNYGAGTQYAIELYTSFLVTLMNSFSGAYIVNQRQIERCCGMSKLVKLWNAIEQGGKEKFESHRAFLNSEASKIYDIHDRLTEETKAMIESRNEIPINRTFDGKDFTNKEEVGNKCSNVLAKYKKAGFETKVGLVAEECISGAIYAAYTEAMNIATGNNTDSVYESGVLEVCTKKFIKNLDNKQIHVIERTLSRDINALREAVQDYECTKESALKVSSIVLEMINCKNLL